MRWYAKAYHTHWPGVFGMPTDSESDDVYFWKLFLPGAALYIIHWSCHVFWMILSGRHHSI